MASIKSAEFKARQAKVHLDALQARIKRFVESEAQQPTAKDDLEKMQYVVAFHKLERVAAEETRLSTFVATESDSREIVSLKELGSDFSFFWIVGSIVVCKQPRDEFQAVDFFTDTRQLHLLLLQNFVWIIHYRAPPNLWHCAGS
jgi:hypothetical protein